MKRLMLVALPTVLLVVLSLLAFPAVLAVHAAAPSHCAGWKRIASPNAHTGSGLSAVATLSASDIWAVGSSANVYGTYKTLTEHWNGTQWSVVASPNVGPASNVLNSVAAISSTDVWAVGEIFGPSSSQQTLIEHWDGTQWSVVASPDPSSVYSILSGVTAISSSNVWAVGNAAGQNRGTITLIEHWNGAQWSVVASPNPVKTYSQLQAITVISARNIWAVGQAGNPGVYTTLIEQWNGSAWTVIPSPSVAKNANFLYSVSAIAANNVWAAGVATPRSGGNETGLVEHWNGSQWSIVASPNPGGPFSLNAVTAVPGTKSLWSVGYYLPPHQYGARTLTEQYCA